MKVAWISYFPVEWLPDLPEPLRHLPRMHPASWQRVLLDEFMQVPELKVHVIRVHRHFPRSLSFERGGATIHCLKLPPGMRTLSLFWWETFLIRRCLRSLKPDLVHAWGTERGAALVASRLGCPYLVSMQGLLEWCAQLVRPRLLSRLVDIRVERRSLRRASIVTAESNFAVGWLRAHYPHLEVRHVEHAPSWIFHRIARRPESNPLQFLSIGSMEPLKGTDLLLQALDRLRSELDFRLIIVGNGTPAFVRELRRTTSAELWKRVTFRQGLTPEQVGEEIARATMLLFPTRADNSPNAVKEAVVGGLPVIGSAIGGIVDYVLPGCNGLTFAPGNLEQFIEAIRSAAAHPLFSRGRVDPETLNRVRDCLSPSLMAGEFKAAYQQVLATRARSHVPP